MRMHPAMKQAKAMFRRAGIDVLAVGTLSMHVVCREYNERPLIVDIKLSAEDEVGRIDVCEFCSGHTMYQQVLALHGTEFAWGDAR